ncbi:TAXI family TRAP transporter solute-binding subunit [Pseudorhodoplanes sp.]|uniref:TAXI family TRAP transporter solute-binding subunit n=1 Tax=Pseudorhodoplanes sp. TaxID=1934341 RepID=UPI002CE5AD8E|nr:TAXI family TRAP transporter solute-binding subunit [Pseudorhodoplanes sp.]HWV55316.1 TAXI family TRAP transporter solute-binding subunit [Pseudorhodoplanes sp.]
MKERTRSRWLAASTAGLAIAVAASAATIGNAQERKSIRLATASVDTYGYKVAAALVKVAEEALGGEYTITVNPYPATTAAMKATMDGNGELGYTADIGMTELYGSEGGFKNYKAGKGMLVHTWYAYPMETFIAVPADKAAQYKCLKDLSGKPTFFSPAGFMNWSNFMRTYKALGYDFKHVQIDPKTQADALKAGTIAASVAYTTAGASLVPYWKETEIRMDVKVVNPCPDEIAKLKAAGLSVVEVNPKVFSKDVGVQTISGVPILFAFNMRADMPEDVVYRLLTGLYKNRDALVKSDPGFAPLAKDFVGMQVSGISANPQIPVHPGLAKFLKEHKAWNDSWKIANSGS